MWSVWLKRTNESQQQSKWVVTESAGSVIKSFPAWHESWFSNVFSGHVQACRALMIIAMVLLLGAIIISMLGLKCIKIGSATEQSKGKLAGTGGILALLGGEAPALFSMSFFEQSAGSGSIFSSI